MWSSRVCGEHAVHTTFIGEVAPPCCVWAVTEGRLDQTRLTLKTLCMCTQSQSQTSKHQVYINCKNMADADINIPDSSCMGQIVTSALCKSKYFLSCT